MKTFILTINFFNEKSWEHFLKLLKKTFKNRQINIIKIGRFIVNKKIVTILKSPHVNKIAQEQFEKKEKSIQMLIISKNFNKIMVVIKTVFNKLFSDMKITVKYLTNKTLDKMGVLNILKIINFKLNSFKKTNINKNFQKNELIKKNMNLKRKSIKFKIYLKMLNNYGEIVVVLR